MGRKPPTECDGNLQPTLSKTPCSEKWGLLSQSCLYHGGNRLPGSAQCLFWGPRLINPWAPRMFVTDSGSRVCSPATMSLTWCSHSPIREILGSEVSCWQHLLFAVRLGLSQWVRAVSQGLNSKSSNFFHTRSDFFFLCMSVDFKPKMCAASELRSGLVVAVNEFS